MVIILIAVILATCTMHGSGLVIIHVDLSSLSTNHKLASHTLSSNANVSTAVAAVFFRADIN